MPIYEYVCKDCGAPLEKLQKLSDAALVDCPACGQASLKRKVSAAGFRLSGGGWYETDFKSDKRRNLSGDGESANASSSKDESSGQSASSGNESKTASAESTSPSGSTASGDKKTASPTPKSSGAGAD